MTRLAGALLAMTVLVVAPLTGCGDDNTEPTETDLSGGQLHPDVVDVDVTAESAHVFRFAVTVSSPYDSPDRYADAWRVVAPDGTVFATRELAHDHAGEQPFTRSLAGVEIPGDVGTVVIEARDLANGWGGTTIEVEVPHRKG